MNQILQQEEKDDSMSLVNLPNDMLGECLSYLGPGNYLFVAGVCRSFRDTYVSLGYPKQNETGLNEIVASVSRFKMVLKEWETFGCRPIKIIWRGRKVMARKVMIEYAAWKGNLSVLSWAKENEGCNWDTPTTSGACGEAARGGHLEVLRWLRKEGGCRWDSWHDETCKNAAAGGHLEVLKWAYLNGCPCYEQTCSFAAKYGHLETLKWARKNGCPWSSWTCAYAAEGGYLELLKWSHQNGCPWDEFTCARAAKGGHLKILKWARQNNCPWDKRTSSSAMRNGHLEVLKWALDNGCP